MPRDTEYKYVVRIDWATNWNEKCVYALEHFGLPGHRFLTHAQEDYMEFKFRNEVDAIKFNLACL